MDWSVSSQIEVDQVERRKKKLVRSKGWKSRRGGEDGGAAQGRRTQADRPTTGTASVVQDYLRGLCTLLWVNYKVSEYAAAIQLVAEQGSRRRSSPAPFARLVSGGRTGWVVPEPNRLLPATGPVGHLPGAHHPLPPRASRPHLLLSRGPSITPGSTRLLSPARVSRVCRQARHPSGL